MPSNRYSFVRGRPPLMRGSCDGDAPAAVPPLPGSATPGASDARVMNVRPFSGSRTTSDPTTAPRLAVSARRNGASAVTVICSRTSPSTRLKSSRIFSPVESLTPSRRTGVNPARATSTR